MSSLARTPARPTPLRPLACTLVLSSLLLACEGGGRDPVTPELGPSATRADLEAAGPSVTGGMASGHADIHGTTISGITYDETFSFTAKSTGAFPLAKGQAVLSHATSDIGEDFTMHADVTCLAVVGNQAWVGARIRRFIMNGEEWSGAADAPAIFRVVDTGEGGEVTDQASLLYFPLPGTPLEDEMTYCNTRPGFPILRTELAGNVQVKPE